MNKNKKGKRVTISVDLEISKSNGGFVLESFKNELVGDRIVLLAGESVETLLSKARSALSDLFSRRRSESAPSEYEQSLQVRYFYLDQYDQHVVIESAEQVSVGRKFKAELVGDEGSVDISKLASAQQ